MKSIQFALLNSVRSQPWAITMEMYHTIEDVLYERYISGEGRYTMDIEALAERNKKETRVEKKVAIVPLVGVLAKRANLFSDVSGMTSTELFKAEMQKALDNPEVDAIVMDIDSHGGTVDGTKEVADFVYANRAKKPILAYANGSMQSGAYYIGSAASKVTAYDTAILGSIGVIMTHMDLSVMDTQRGVKRTQIYAGKYKGMARDSEPLTDESRKYLQELVDKTYSIFVDSVAMYRGVSTKYALDNMADGKQFLAKDALEAKLIDRIMTLEGTVEWAARMATWKAYQKGGLDAESEAALEALVELDLTYGRDDPIHSVSAISHEEVIGDDY